MSVNIFQLDITVHIVLLLLWIGCRRRQRFVCC